MATTNTKKNPETIRISIPYVDGEDPEQVVGINGKLYKIRKGEPVDVPYDVWMVLENSGKQVMAAKQNREKLKEQVFDV